MKIYSRFPVLLFTLFSFSLLPGCRPDTKTAISGSAKMVFKSADGGQSWQDISKGLPENLRKDSILVNSFFANENGLYYRTANGLYHSLPDASDSFWTRETLPEEHSQVTPGKSGMAVNKYWGVHLIKSNGTDIWSPLFENSVEPRIRSTFETASGALFIGTNSGFFKTDDDGKTWKQVHSGGLADHLAESDGILLAISMQKIIRSTGNGESWAATVSEDSVAFDVKPINGGFAAITAGSASAKRRLSTSYDGGKTWQRADTSLSNKAFIDSTWRTWNVRPLVKSFGTSIFQVGETLVCVHPHGIFRSTDKGKTWTLTLPAVENKVFYLFESGTIMYAIAAKGGC